MGITIEIDNLVVTQDKTGNGKFFQYGVFLQQHGYPLNKFHSDILKLSVSNVWEQNTTDLLWNS